MYTNIIGKFLSTAMVLHDFACPHKLHNLLCIIFFTRLVRKIIIHHTTMNYIFKWSGTLAAMYSPKVFPFIFWIFFPTQKILASRAKHLFNFAKNKMYKRGRIWWGWNRVSKIQITLLSCICMYMAGYYLKVSKKF